MKVAGQSQCISKDRAAEAASGKNWLNPARIMARKVCFPDSEWAFHKVPKHELRLCAKWELARLCGQKQKPWLKLTDKTKVRFTREQSSLQEIPAKVGNWLNGWLKKETRAVKTITFLIDFQEHDGALIEMFRYWLKSSKRKEWQQQHARWRSLLVKSVVLRATEV